MYTTLLLKVDDCARLAILALEVYCAFRLSIVRSIPPTIQAPRYGS